MLRLRSASGGGDINSRRLQPVDLNEATRITRCMQGFATSRAAHAAELYAGFRNPRDESRG